MNRKGVFRKKYQNKRPGLYYRDHMIENLGLEIKSNDESEDKMDPKKTSPHTNIKLMERTYSYCNGLQLEDVNLDKDKSTNKKMMKNLVKKHKIINLVHNFKQKLKRTQSYSFPLESDLEYFQNQTQNMCCSLQGFESKKNFDIFLNILYIIQFAAAFIFYLIGIIFYHEVQRLKHFWVFQYVSLVVLIIQIFQGILCQKIAKDRKLKKITQIFMHYAKDTFVIDSICLVTLVIDLNGEWMFLRYLRLCFFLKVPQFFRKMTELQIFFVTNFQRQQYWGVIKVFVINFLIAHLIAIAYLILGQQPDSWMSTMGLNIRQWDDQYAYAYFWGMSTMLGFGNAIPSTSREAMFISVIECLSCIVLAYIINHVGTLLTNIAKKNGDKQKNLQISRRLADENNISEELLSKINNYIRQTDSIEKRFNFKMDNKFLTNLPDNLKDQFLKESNKKTFQHLFFFKKLNEKSMLSLAEIIKVKIAHPLETIFSRNVVFKFIILKKGEVNYFSSYFDPKQRKPFNNVRIQKNDYPMILDLSIFTPEQRQNNITIKAQDFSIIYELQFPDFKMALNNLSFDYQKFCELRDKSKHIIDEFQVITCPHCCTKHNKILCPRLHFSPFKSMIIYRQLEKVEVGINFRKEGYRLKKVHLSPLHIYRDIFEDLEKSVFKNRGITFYERMETKRATGKKQFRIQTFMIRSKSLIEGQSLKNQDFEGSTPNIKKMKKLMEDCLRNKNKTQLWNLQLDELYDFKGYFPSNNPYCLKNYLFIPKNQSIHTRPSSHKSKKTFKKNIKAVINPTFYQLF